MHDTYSIVLHLHPHGFLTCTYIQMCDRVDDFIYVKVGRNDEVVHVNIFVRVLELLLHR